MNHLSHQNLSNALSIFALILLINFFVSAFSEAYETLGWNAPVNIALFSLGAAFVLSLIAACLQYRNTLVWVIFIPTILTLAATIYFLATFRLKI